MAKNWKLRGCPSTDEWLNKLWHVVVMEYYSAVRNNELVDVTKRWKDLYEIIKSKMNRTKRLLHTVTAIVF